MEITKKTQNSPKVEKPEIPKAVESEQAPVGAPEAEVVEVSKKAKNSKAITITVDNSPEEVLKLDDAGEALHFEHDPAKFLRLGRETLQKMSFANKQRYFVSKGMAEETLDLSAYDRRKFKPQPGRAMATDRLKIFNEDPNYHYCWKRPDELRQAMMDGYVVENSDAVDTFNSDPGSSHTVGVNGETELVLMKTPIENHKQYRAANREKDKRRREGVKADADQFVHRQGGKPSGSPTARAFSEED